MGESNITYERFIFNKRVQEEGESFELYYADLQRLIKSCDYCDACQKSILKDRIVIGIRDANVQKDLLKVRDLSVDKAVDICRASEKATSHNNMMRPTVNKISERKENKTVKICKFCGSSHVWDKFKCPAYGKECAKCHLPNHFAKQCKTNQFKTQKNKEGQSKSNYKSKNVHRVEEEENVDSDGAEWINNVSTNPVDQAKQIKCKILVNSHLVDFQIDTGSSVNILPIKYVENEDILSTETILKTWNKNNYKPVGEIRKIIINPKNNKKYNVNFIVCHNDFVPIMGLKASEKMSLIEVKSENFESANMIEIEKYKDNVFSDSLGTFQGEYKLKTIEGAQPCMMPNRRIPIGMKNDVDKMIKNLIDSEVILPVNEPSEWLSQVVIVRKSNGNLRLCLDPQELNKVLVREHYSLPTLDHTIHELSQSKMFSKFDLQHGYWHVKIDEESSKLTTCQIGDGTYRFLRLPFGLSVSAEIFQRKLHQSLANLNGVICIADDIVVHGKTKEEHDTNLEKFLQRCNEVGIRLNQKKTLLRKNEIVFMGHKIGINGLEIDQSKIEAIKKFPKPDNVSKLRSFLGIVNFIAKFLPNLSDVLHPLHNLLKKEVKWMWTKAQDDAFLKIKSMIITASNLTIFDPTKKIVLENDASEYGLGSVLMQDNKPVAYASRTLSASERNYAQIEKEMLAIVFGLEKFHHYLYGNDIIIITDHKPLTFIVKKPLSKAPKRIQNMILKTQEYNYSLFYKEGVKIPIADALSRSPLDNSKHVHFVNNLDSTPINKNTFLEIKYATENDPILLNLKEIISSGWPDSKDEVDPIIRHYFHFRDELTIEDGIIMRGQRIIIPKSLQHGMKTKIHAGHMGMNSCLRRARTYLYWPGMSADIRLFVENCPTCSTFSSKQPAQPLILHPLPSRPWQKLGLDIFTINSRNYLVTVDYYSQFFEVDFLSSMTSSNIISKLKSHFARYGIPDDLISDNGPQLVSSEFKKFCKSYSISHNTSAPGNSRANGAAESAVKIAKNLIKKSLHNREDPYIALLNHRNTPQEDSDYTPAQRLLGRRTKTLIPTVPSLLQPECVNHDKVVRHRDSRQTLMSAKLGDKKELPILRENDQVRMQPIDGRDAWKPATVVEQVPNNPRSYIVADESGHTYRRDRAFLRKKPDSVTPNLNKDPTLSLQNTAQATNDDVTQPVEKTVTTTRFGRVVKPPDRY